MLELKISGLLAVFIVYTAFRCGHNWSENNGWGIIDNLISFIVSAVILISLCVKYVGG